MSAILANAPVDLLGHVEDSFLARHRLPKGGTLTLDAPADYAALLHDFEMACVGRGGVRAHPGGCGANTAANIASWGGRVTALAPFGSDAFGALALGDLERRGVHIAGQACGGAHLSLVTAITPDAERSFALHGGQGHPELVRALGEGCGALERETCLLLDGHLLSDPVSAQAILAYLDRPAVRAQTLMLCPNGCEIIAGAQGILAALLARIDHLVLSEAEARLLTASDTPEVAATRLGALGLCGAITLGARGALVFAGEDAWEVPTERVSSDAIVNLNGAGDGFAAGYLLGLERGLGPRAMARLGCTIAAQVIQVETARLERVDSR